MGKTVTVAMAGFDAAKSPDTLTTSGIGSCVAVCLYDAINRIGGLAHIMLPHNRENGQTHPGKYADTAISALVRLMVQNGANQSGLTAKIAGGASILTPAGKDAAITVGKDNLESVKRVLANLNIRITAGDTGGPYGRAVVFGTDTGSVEVTVLTKPPKKIDL
jgi:chemotaxis protein CheD